MFRQTADRFAKLDLSDRQQAGQLPWSGTYVTMFFFSSASAAASILDGDGVLAGALKQAQL